MNHLEMLFHSAFFTIMVHLTSHPVDEAKLGGPVQHQWMYPTERYLGHCKSYVRNMSQPEGSIAEGYLAEEVLTFCSQYIDGIESRINRPRRVDDYPDDSSTTNSSSIFPPVGKGLGVDTFELSPMVKRQAHRYVLLNCPQVAPFINEFKDFVWRRWNGRKPTSTQMEKIVNKDFGDWFPLKIKNPDIVNTVSDDLRFLADGPAPHARRFTSFNINGLKFRTITREHGLKTQNSGVFLTSSTSCIASRADGNLRQADFPYYGKLKDIIELNYYGRFRVTLFKCKWADTTRDRPLERINGDFLLLTFPLDSHW
ncbi:uncharacterized protein LOC132043916 [Lycium ferocissimum]|uniref:uncharacterized protein LOC132043916 n=1 Tax=Lycium ferocissimum TaxID=112874 RepID=UPI0028153852|nr:uncharacterized protein LOC132043916 [Lycium ferocissimum]